MSEQSDPNLAKRWLTTDRDKGRTPDERAAVSNLLAGIRDRVLSGAALRPGYRVLDLGAGAGLLTHTAATLLDGAGSVTAFDVSTAALTEIDTSAGPTAIYRVVGDASHIPIATGRIDRVVARSVLIYLPDLAVAVAEIARVLRPGGRLSAFEPVNARRAHDADLTDLSPGDLDAIDQLRARTSTTSNSMLAFDIQPVTTALSRAGLNPSTTLDEVQDRLTTHAAVDAYLNRSPHPGATTPIDLITKHLGTPAADRYTAAWHQALDRATPERGITFTTPVLYLTATKQPTPTGRFAPHDYVHRGQI
jgi:arsenite methyltransferase